MLLAFELLAALFVLATLVPFAPLSHGFVRIGDFPRVQVFSLALLLLAAAVVLQDGRGPWLAVELAFLAVALVQSWFILPFTPVWRKQTASFDPAADADGTPLKLVASNVKMSNRAWSEMAAMLAARDPDIVILMEVDQNWVDGMAPLLDRYEHKVLVPQDNSYGMVLASRHPLTDTLQSDLLTEGVPSIITTVQVSPRRRFRLYAIHPEPPVPHRGSEGRDGETALVALKVREETLPVLVTGDLNDVAWSQTTHRFRRISRLLDPRVGRRIFATFDARYRLLRWPLDHLFHSPEFRLKDMQRLPPCGSDHFPVLFDLVLCSDEDAESEPEEADSDDIATARELVREARDRDEKPIGSDWEN